MQNIISEEGQISYKLQNNSNVASVYLNFGSISKRLTKVSKYQRYHPHCPLVVWSLVPKIGPCACAGLSEVGFQLATTCHRNPNDFAYFCFDWFCTLYLRFVLFCDILYRIVSCFYFLFCIWDVWSFVEEISGRGPRRATHLSAGVRGLTQLHRHSFQNSIYNFWNSTS